MNKRVLSLVLALVMVLTMLPMTAMAGEADKFTDVSKDKWYYTWIDNVVEKGYFAGTGSNTFSPNVVMNRAMFVTVLANLEGVKLDNSVTVFSDVPAGKWYTGATKWASENGIVSGYPGSVFKPLQPVTREQMSVIMKNYVDWSAKQTGRDHEENGSNKPFADNDKIASWASEAVGQCRQWGLIDGYGDNTLRPQNGSTRAEVAAVVSKLAWLVETGSSVKREEVKTTYTLTYDANGGVEAPDAETVKKDEKFTVAGAGSMTRDGFVFVNWNTKADGSGVSYEPGAKITATANITLYAQWMADDDYIGLAVKDAMELIDSKIDKYGVVDYTDKDADYKHNVLTVDSIVYNAGSAATPKAARPQSVSMTGQISSELAEQIIARACGFVYNVVGNGQTAREDVDAVVDLVIGELEDEAGLTITRPFAVAQIKQEIKDKITAGRGVWEAFHNNSGKYVTGDVTVSTGNAQVVIDVTDGQNTTIAGTREENVKKTAKMIVAVARDMYADLAQETEYTGTVELSATVNVKFSASATYAAATDKYAYEYPVTVNVTLKGNDLVEYKYADGESFVKLNVTEGLQKEYEDQLDRAIKTILSKETVKTEANAVVDSAMTEVKNSGTMQQVKNGLVKFGYSASLLDDAMETWKDTNLLDDQAAIEDSKLFALIWNDQDVDWDNNALYSLVALIGTGAGEFVEEKIVDKFGTGLVTEMIMENANVGILEELADEGLTIDLGTYPAAVKTYVLARVADHLNQEAGVTANNTTPAIVNAMKAELDTKVEENINAEVIDAKIESHKYGQYLAQAKELKTVESMSDETLTKFINLIKTQTFKQYAAKGSSALNYVERLVAALPAKGSVTVNGMVISEAALQAVRDAQTTDELCDAVADFLAPIKTMTLNDFAPKTAPAKDGVAITAAYGARTFVVNAVVEIK